MFATLMSLPTEVRLVVYQLYLSDHRIAHNRRQPTNAHFRLLRVCKLIRREAISIVFSYVSLLHEHQIRAFIQTVPDEFVASVAYADVANDGRLIKSSNVGDTQAWPLSHLHIALKRLRALRHLRVFECRQGFPINLGASSSKWFILDFERAMFLREAHLRLHSYQLYLSSTTRVTALENWDVSGLRCLRLSGDCQLPRNLNATALREVEFRGVTGNYFDRHGFDEWCHSAPLHTFIWALEEKIGFEIRDNHIQFLAYGSARNLCKLVLLGCSRLTSSVLADCLRQMTSLEYFAISLTTVEEQRANLVLALPSSLTVFKIAVINAWYASPLKAEEHAMCEAIETRLQNHELRLTHIALHFRPSIMLEKGDRWQEIAAQAGCTLYLGSWQDSE